MIEFYLLFGCFIGLLIIIDGVVLKNENGQLGANKIQSVTSLIEFLWAVFSIYLLVKIQLSGITLLVPVLYITHNVLGWLYGFYILSKVEGELENISQIIVPNWYIQFGIVFGVVYSCASLLCYIQINS